MYSDVDGLGTVGCVCASRRILAKRSAQHSGRGGASRALRRPCDGCVSAAHVRTSLAPEPAQAVNNGLRQAEARSADSPPCLAFGAARCDMLLPDQTYEGAERRGAGALLVMLRAHRLPPDFFCANRAAQERANGTTPLSIRLNKGIQNKLIDFVENYDETADQITKVLFEILDKHNLKLSQVTSYGADNANVNFGSNHSVFMNLVAKNENILQANCSVHILHNLRKFACDRLDIDTEAIILKIYAHFSYSAERRAELMQIFETIEMEWVELLRYVNTRFMSLCPAVESFHHQGLACLKRYFDKQESCSKAIEKNFYSEAEETKLKPTCILFIM
ncbi:unnamed protein product [Arctia plantaginis]|uniref:Uncharacterized protein n=1 Tax=Arctia plantaginis TaxID=874455 RepID=A0A8S1BP22_ARCPL|nr:unnamed protein product [Arctia plantaginis]